MTVIDIDRFYDLGVQGVIAETRRVIGDGPVYISFDVDGLDPAYAPAAAMVGLCRGLQRGRGWGSHA